MIKLTMENGKAVWVSQVFNVREPFDYERADWGAGSHVDTFAGGYLVRETPEEVLELIAEERDQRGLLYSGL